MPYLMFAHDCLTFTKQPNRQQENKTHIGPLFRSSGCPFNYHKSKVQFSKDIQKYLIREITDIL